MEISHRVLRDFVPVLKAISSTFSVIIGPKTLLLDQNIFEKGSSRYQKRGLPVQHYDLFFGCQILKDRRSYATLFLNQKYV